MRNKINLLKSWLVRILSFMFILNSSTFAASSYLEPIDIPAYNSNDSTHVLITPTNGKWSNATLNNLSYKHFYIEPGDYGTTALSISSAGTIGSRRTLSLYNGNNIHPASLANNEQASARFNFRDGAAYWTIDRLSLLDKELAHSMEFGTERATSNGSEPNHIIINRWYLRNFKYGIKIYEFCDNNTVQNSYFDTQVDVRDGIKYDGIAMNIHFGRGHTTASIKNTKMIDCDVRNTGDAFQPTHFESNNPQNCNGEGTIVDGNRIWIDSDVTRDASNNLDPSGKYAWHEEGIDLKLGSQNPENPMVISNNIIWGFNTILPEKVGSVGIFTHFGVKNVKINNNIIHNSSSAFSFDNVDDFEAKNNIIYKMNVFNPEDLFKNTVSFTDYTNGLFQNNTIVLNELNSRNGGNVVLVNNTTSNANFSGNVFISAYNAYNPSNLMADNNWYYEHTGPKLGGTNEHTYATTAEAHMGDYTFKYERYTASPKSKTLIGILSTVDSPHDQKAGSSITNETPALSEENTINTHWIIRPDTKELIKQ